MRRNEKELPSVDHYLYSSSCLLFTHIINYIQIVFYCCIGLQTQMHSLSPFGADLFSEDKVEDNMTWNFVAGIAVAREILESYGCVVRIISPRTRDAALGAGGTRIELWLPSFTEVSDFKGHAQEV